MPSINIDFREILQLSESLAISKDQLPFAISRSLNDALFATRRVLIEQLWPSSVEQKNPNFPRVVLHVNKASKQHLSGSIVENKETSVPLILHATGGTRPAPKGRWTIPLSWYRAGKETQHGLSKRAYASALIARTPKRALRITSKGIFIGEHGKLKMVFAFSPTIKVPKDVRFYEVFEQEMRTRLNAALPGNLIAAMATRKKK
jgi:hypothetical protein